MKISPLNMIHNNIKRQEAIQLELELDKPYIMWLKPAPKLHSFTLNNQSNPQEIQMVMSV